MDYFEVVFEVVEVREEELGFDQQAGDFGGEGLGVYDVGVEEGGVAEADGAEGREEGGHDGGEVGVLGLSGLLEGEVVEDALRPARGGEDYVDGAADVGVEFLEVVGGGAGVFDEVVEF